jgi:FAD/FMN-containing dehydrogenase
LQEHSDVVSKLANQVKGFYKHSTAFKVFHGSTNSTKIQSFNKNQMIDISSLNNILSIDTIKRTAIVEPNVPMDALVKATLQHGHLPPLVMEFPGITVGGGIQGNGGESSSFKWGCFNEIFNWYEVISGNGTIHKVSSANKADLFYGLPGSAGTLGVLTAAEVKLIPSKKYVKTTYLPVKNFSELQKTIDDVVTKNFDFVDAILFSKDRGVVIVGTLQNEKETLHARFSRAVDEWYYLHVENTLATQPNGWTESVPIEDYLFRYDRGAFWVGRYAFWMANIPFNRFTRWLLNPLLHTRKLYQALQESGASQMHFVQDIVVPKKNTESLLVYLDKTVPIYPLWICPMKPNGKTPFQLNNINTDVVMNIGIWGDAIHNREEFLRLNRAVENKIIALSGKKWTYSHAYYTEKEFWHMYDKIAYEKLRNKYYSSYLPTLYDKTVVKEIYPIHRKKGAIKTLFGLAKLRVS